MTNNIVLIDDELHCTESLGLLLNKIRPDLNIVARMNSSTEGLTYLSHHKADLVFLDIEMPGMTGFELLNKLTNIDFDVVFVTAYNQYAIKAFNYSAISYLLKPVDEDELVSTLQRWEEKKTKVLQSGQLDLMNKLMTGHGDWSDRIALPTAEGLEFVEVASITRCESSSNYTWIMTSDQTKMLICRTLKEVENTLKDSGFLRIHHSHLINPRYVRKFLRGDGGGVVMSDGTHIAVSRGKKDHLTHLLNSAKKI